jgi:parallel beta-helix repeat protein
VGGLTTCQNLDQDNTTYTLVVNVSSADTCFTIAANNITLDCNGYTINYSYSSLGYAVFNRMYNYTTIKNCNILTGKSGISNAHAIHINGTYATPLASTNITIVNNTITTLGNFAIWFESTSYGNVSNNKIYTFGTNGEGIELFASDNNVVANNYLNTSDEGLYITVSSYNLLLNNNVTANDYGLELFQSYSNNVTGGSIISRTYDYRMRFTDDTNNITDTNFTAMRSILFSDRVASSFVYNNQTNGNIWLKTNSSVVPSSINRTLVNWNNTLMQWNDTNSTTMTVNYTLKGLISNNQYNVYNTSDGVQTNPYTITTDSNGGLSFTIVLNKNTEIQVVNYSVAADTTPPTYSLNSTNSTLAGTPILHSLNWTDNVALSSYIFSFDNCTGTLANDSAVAFNSGTWSNVTKTINSTISCTIRWCAYANDTLNNWNGTSCTTPFSYVTTSAGGAPSCRVDIGPPQTTDIIFNPWSPIAKGVPAKNQTSTYGILNLTNNGTASATGFQLKINNTVTGWTMKCSNTSTYTNSIIVDTTSRTVYTGSIAQDAIIQEWCWIDLSYPTKPWEFEYSCNALS